MVPSQDNGLIALFEGQYGGGYLAPETMWLAFRNRMREHGFGQVKLERLSDLGALEGAALVAAREIIPTLQIKSSDSAAASLL